MMLGWRTLLLLLIGATLVRAHEMTPLLAPGLYGGAKLTPEYVSWSSRVVRALPPLQQLLNTSNVDPALLSPECKLHLDLYSLGITNLTPWALTMLDASTKVPESVLSGAFIHLGNFDQCLGVTAQLLGSAEFTAQYCGTGLVFTSMAPESSFALALQVATCLPATCQPREIQEFVQSTLVPPLSLLGVKVTVVVDPLNCYKAEDKEPLDATAWSMIGVFSVLIAFMVIGSILDFSATRSTSSKGGRVLLAFSLRGNLARLASTRQQAPGTVACLHGLRVFSLLWVMLGHRYGITASVPLINTLDLLTLLPNKTFSLVMNGLLAVDTFFFLSGFLMCYVFMGDMSKGRPFNPLKFYLYRYLRLTTSLALLIGYYVGPMRFTGTGPAWRLALNWQVDLCKQAWWLNLLYFNNYVQLNPYDPANLAPICIDQGWYLTVDMQLAWLAPLLLVPLWRWPRLTSRLVLPLVTLASCLAPFTSTLINHFPMTNSMLVTPEEAFRYGYEMYYATHMRATPYLVGLALAFLMFGLRNHRIVLPAWVVTAGWAASTATSLAVVLGASVMYAPGYVYDPLASAFYAGFHRLAWALALAWIVFACTRGYGGPVNAILSCKALLPLSRLAYCMYLTHGVLLYFDAGNTRTLSYFSHFSAVHTFLGDILVTAGLALLLHVVCEAPTLNLLRLVFNRGTVNETKDLKEMTEKSDKGMKK